MNSVHDKHIGNPLYEKKISEFLIWAPVLLIPLLQTSFTIDANLHIRFLSLSVYLLTLCIFSFFVIKRNSTIFFSDKTFFVLFFLYAAFSIPGNVLSPYASGEGIFEWIKIFFLPALVFLFFVIFGNQHNFKTSLSKSVTTLAAIIIVLSLFEFFQVWFKKEISHLAFYDIKATFAHKNILSEMFFLFIPFTLFCLLSLKKFWRWLGFFCAFFSTVFIVLLMTRAVWLSFALSGFFVALVFFFQTRNKRISSFRAGKSILFVVVFSIIVAVTFGVLLYINKENLFAKQLFSIFNFGYGSSKERIILWENSLKIFYGHPFFGVGLGNWKTEILKYGSSGLSSENTTTFYQRPHNDFLWILSEQGIFAFLVYVSILIGVFYSIFKIIFKTNNSEERIFFYMILFALTGYCVFSFFSFPKERAEHLLFLSFIITPVLLHREKYFIVEKKSGKEFVLIVLVLLTVLSVCSVALCSKLLHSEKHLASSFKARNGGDWKTMICEIDSAESFFYRIDPVSTPLRWYRGLANYNRNNMQDAFYDFKIANSYSPYHIHTLNNLGTCYELAANHAEAISCFEKALSLSPAFDEARFNLCASYFNSGNAVKAYLELRKINNAQSAEKYNHFLSFALPAAINEIAKSTDEKTKIHIERARNTMGWLNSIHFKSVENNISLEKQLFLDLIYTFETIERDSAEANRLRNKYSHIINF